jgi:ATP-dependent Lhr-like helicase
VVLAATDPANPYGATLAWPAGPPAPATPVAAPATSLSSGIAAGGDEPGRRDGHRPGRKAGALVVLVDGDLAIYVERGGKTLLSFAPSATDTTPEDFMRIAVEALALAVRDGWLGRLDVERANGGSVWQSPLGAALEAAGFRATPKGLRLRG